MSCLCRAVRGLGDVEGVQYQNVVVVLSQGHHVALRRDLQAAATRHLNVRAFKLADERAIALEYRHMETVAMGVSDQHISGVANINPVGEVGDIFTADASHELPIFIEDYHTVALQEKTTMFRTRVSV